MKNPYPETISDGAWGVEVPNNLHKAWQEGYEAAKKEEEIE